MLYLCGMAWNKKNTNIWDNNNYQAGKDEDGNQELSDKLLKVFKEKTCIVVDKVVKIGLPKEKEQIRIITTQAFNSIAIIKHIADIEKVVEGVMVIFAINIEAAKVLIELKNEGKISNIKMVISSIRNAGIKDKSKAVEMLKNHFDIKFITSHAKITILKTEKNNYYSIEGSGNFSFNARLEQYIIDNDKMLFDFSKQWMQEVEKISRDTMKNTTK